MKNGTARLLKGSAISLWVMGAATALWLWFRWKPDIAESGNWIAAAVAAGFFLCGLFFWALGEITAILHCIREKGFSAPPVLEPEQPKPGLYVEDMVSFQPAQTEPDPVLNQVETFIWVCPACGEINLSASGHCRICKAERLAKAETPEPPMA